MRLKTIVAISTVFAFFSVPDVWAGPYVGVTQYYFDTTQSGQDPVSHGNSIGGGLVVGIQTSEPDRSQYGIELEYDKAREWKGWGGSLAGVFGTFRSSGSTGMGQVLLRIGAVNTDIKFSDAQSQNKTNAALGFGWGVMRTGSLGIEVTLTAIVGKVVGDDELTVFGIRWLYAW